MSSVILPDAYIIIIGAMKAGTTTLFSMLSQHPSICPAQTKEPEFFSQSQGHGLKVDRYEDLFPYNTDIHTRCLEASTGYTKFPMEIDVPSRMKEYGIEPLFIYSVRNPIDRIESDFNFAQLNNKYWAKDDILNLRAIQNSMYFMQMREFLNYYPNKDRYFIVDFDCIISEPVELAQRIFEWAGIKNYKIEISTPQNVTPSFSNTEKKLKGLPIPWNDIIPKKMRKSAIQFLRQNDASAKQKLTQYQKEKLHHWLGQDIKRFGNTFNFNVEKWGFEGKKG